MHAPLDVIAHRLTIEQTDWRSGLSERTGPRRAKLRDLARGDAIRFTG
jgi:hypothetical protein